MPEYICEYCLETFIERDEDDEFRSTICTICLKNACSKEFGKNNMFVVFYEHRTGFGGLDDIICVCRECVLQNPIPPGTKRKNIQNAAIELSSFLREVERRDSEK